jgi:hypothetical protein
MTLIPKGTALNTYPGYWLDGSYTTVITERGVLDFEISLTLHAPTLATGGIYQIWHQIYDEYETLEQDDGEDYYESYACAIRYNEVSVANVTSQNTWGIGFRGKNLLKNAVGKHN